MSCKHYPKIQYAKWHTRLVRVGLGIVLLFFSLTQLQAQCGTGTSTIHTIDFSAQKDTSWSITDTRGGTACVGTSGADNTCIRFNVKLNSGSDLLNFSSGQITGASFYSINCGALIPIGTPACITGLSTVCISFCKPGNNSVTYTVTASSVIRGSEDLVLREGCSGTMSVSGIQASSVNWRSVFPGASGAYNSYLSQTSGVTSVTVTPQTGAPSYIDYEVSGTGTCTGTRRDTIRIYAVPAMSVAISPATPAICNGTSVTLASTITGGNPPYVYSWNSGQSTSSINVSTIGTYTLSVTDNTVGCPAAQQSATVSAAPTPSAPTVPAVATCSGSTATISVSNPSGTHQWFSVASGGTALATGNSFTTPVLTANTTYYVQTTVNGCTSSRTAVTVTVNAIPVSPTASGATICAGTSTNLTATAPGGSYSWYNAASGGSLLTSTSAYLTPVLNSSTTYYVQTLVNGCTSQRTAVVVNVTPLPAAPTAAGTSICIGNSATLTATAPGGTYSWYDAATGGNLIATGVAYTAAFTNTTTYYVDTRVNNCTSASRTPVTVTVNPLPATPTVNNPGICAGNSTSLTANSADAASYQWYDAATNGLLLQSGTGNTYTTPVLNSSVNYYVSVTSAAGCISSRQTASITVTPIQNPSFSYVSSTFCTTDFTNPTQTPSIPGGVSGTFSVLPATGLTLNTTNGTIGVTTSTPGSYSVTFSVNAGCALTSSVTINIISSTPVADFVYSATEFCKNQSNTTPIFINGGIAGVFSAPAGLDFQNDATGEINFANSNAGTYLVTNTITGSGGCATVSNTYTIEIKNPPTANAGTDQIVCSGSTVNLTGLFGGTASSGSWTTTGTGVLTNQSAGQASYVPANGENSTAFTFTTNDPAGACTAVSDQMIVQYRALPAAPQVFNDPICSGTTATLTAYSPGGTYQWFDTPNAITPIASGAVLSRQLNTATTFYVSATSADGYGCVGPRTAVPVVVNALPVVTPATLSVCSGEPFTQNLSADIVGTNFTWSRAAVNNISNAVVANQSTATIAETLTNIGTATENVMYVVVPTANGCTGSSYQLAVAVKPLPVAPIASTSGTVCEGASFTLSASAITGASYAWTGPNGFTSNSQSPIISNATSNMQGTYAVTARVNGCVGAAASVTQNINTRPAVPSVLNSSPVCEGTDVNFSTDIVVGATYQWSGPNGFTSSNINPVINNANAGDAGNYQLVIMVNGCASNAATTAVTVNQLPAALNLSTDGPVCVNQPINLYAELVNAGTYSWTGPNGFTSSDRVFTIASLNTLSAGTYRAIVSVAGCAGVANSIEASLKPTPLAPTVQNVTPVCVNGSLTLTVNPVVAGVYSWTGPNNFTSTAAAPIINNIQLANAGDYFVRVTVDGCPSTNTQVNVAVKPLPVVNALNSNGPVCVGATIKLSTPFVSGATYNWTGPAAFTSNLQNPLITNAGLSNAGNYGLSLTVDGCAGPVSPIAVVVNPPPDTVAITSSGPACESQPLRLTAAVLTGASYQWTGPGGFTANTREILLPSMSAATAGVYQVAVSVAGCQGVANSINAILKPTPAAPVISATTPVCENATATFNAIAVAGASYQWTGPGGFTSTAQQPVINNIRLNQGGTYAATISVDGCVSSAATTSVTIIPLPAQPLLSSNGPVCLGNTLRLSAATVTGAAYQWTGPNGFTSNQKDPVIASATANASGIYLANLIVNGCAGPVAGINVAVNPLPGKVGIVASGPACEGRSLRMEADSVVAGTYQWTGPNGFASSNRTVFIPSMDAQKSGTYEVAVSVAGCPGTANNYDATLKPTPNAPIISTSPEVCENKPIKLLINPVPGGVYQWTGPLNFSSSNSNPVIDSARLGMTGNYAATVMVNGCISNASSVALKVLPQPAVPVISSNSPVCTGDALQLRANTIAGATYVWKGKNTFTAALQNPLIPVITAADSGNYAAVLTVNGCTSDTAYTKVQVDIPANVFAGNNLTVCANNAVVDVSGIINGGTRTGFWTSSGTGKFNARTNGVSATYTPSNADTAAGLVQLTLTSSNNGACRAVSSSLLLTITDAPFVNLGTDKIICANDSIIPLNPVLHNAGGVQWTSFGTGSFDPSNQSLMVNYLTSKADRTTGNVRLQITTTGNGNCMAVSDQLLVNLSPAPLVNAGTDRFVFEDMPYTLSPTVSSNVRSYLWSPATYLNDPTIANPVFKGKQDQLLTLKVTSNNGCTAEDEVFLTVLKPFPIPNVFSPNGDGIHDTWVIPELEKYPGAEVSVFDRTGRRVFYTNGYQKPWDGTFQGKPLPVATYYYVINPILIPSVFSGSVTILR